MTEFKNIKTKASELGVSPTLICLGVTLFKNGDYKITNKIAEEAKALSISEDKINNLSELFMFAYILNVEFYVSNSRLRMRKIEVYNAKDIEV